MGFKLTKPQEKMVNLIFVDDIKVFYKIEEKAANPDENDKKYSVRIKK